MAIDFLEELTWRGLLQDKTPGCEDYLNTEMATGYVGFDPTADSLHIGNLVPVMLLVHLQRAGHKPIVLIGGATGMVGDPSGKTAERQFLDVQAIQHNLDCQRSQLERFLDFDCGKNSAELVNNYDWFKDFTFLDFIRDAGKHITVNYMLAKESVKNRLEGGMSFTEFSYQLVQGYDFYWLHKNKDCRMQMGGSDQWGNMTTGTEFIRRKSGGEGHALTAPLLKKSDGTKFGKSEGGNIWLDAKKTSPYRFYQYWLNAADDDVEKLIKIFTLKSKAEIDALIEEHRQAPGARILQKALASDITAWIHGQDEVDNAIKASAILFGKGTKEELASIPAETFLSAMDGVPMTTISSSEAADMSIIDALVTKGGFLKSNGEARRALKENSISVNKTKVTDQYIIEKEDLIHGRFVLLQRGKKNYYVLEVEK